MNLTTRRTFLNTTGSAVALGALGGMAQQHASAATPGAASTSDPLCFASASELAQSIRSKRISARDVMTAHLAQIARLNPKLNAIVAKLPDDECLALAEAADRQRARGGPLGPLHGLPIAIKDTEPVVGFPFTRGSPIFRNDMPKA